MNQEATAKGVTFYDGSKEIGSAPLVYAPATGTVTAHFTSSTLALGTHSVTAQYNGDSTSNPSKSSALTLTVWSISLTASPNPSVVGQMVTFSACGIPSGGVPGTLALLDGSATLLTNTNVSGPCSTFGTNILTQGSHNMSVRYAGGIATAAVVQVVNSK